LKDIINHLEKGIYKVGYSSIINLFVDTFIQRLLGRKVDNYKQLDTDNRDWANQAVDMLIKHIETSEPFGDYFGEIYETFSSKYARSGLGQFFTPSNVSDLISELVGVSDNQATLPYSGIQQAINENRLFRVYEPTAGSGRLILSACKKVWRVDPVLLSHIAIVTVDLDCQCVKMQIANFLATKFIHKLEVGELEIYQGNSLSYDTSLIFGYGHKYQQQEAA
jgi:type I restriction-modification system DNA methylase subunit